MAGPALLIPFLSVAARSVGVLLRRWQGITALIGLVVASGFTFNAMVRQMADTALNLWPLLALACFFLLAKEFLRAWFKVRKAEVERRRQE